MSKLAPTQGLNPDEAVHQFKVLVPTPGGVHKNQCQRNPTITAIFALENPRVMEQWPFKHNRKDIIQTISGFFLHLQYGRFGSC